MEILKVKTRNRRVGDFGEKAAEKLLKRKKFKIIHRNYVAVDHEIDIIAENKDTTVFVEVKTREASENEKFPTRPAAAVTRDKREAIVKAASYYIGFNPNDKKKRFDVIEVYITEENGKLKVLDINHMEGAFNKNDAYKTF